MGRANVSKKSFVYNVDMAFVIDATLSMDDLLDVVKKNAVNFYSDVCGVMLKKNKQINKLRVRIIAFRDYIADKNDAMLVTDFFDLPAQAHDFSDCVNDIEAMGGGDEPEDGLEGLAYAIKSKWDTDKVTSDGKPIKHRHVIVVWSDASTHELGFGKSEPNYPKNMAADMRELTSWWDELMSAYSKRLVLFTPAEEGWATIGKTWDNTYLIPTVAGDGLQEVDYNQIINIVGGTISA